MMRFEFLKSYEGRRYQVLNNLQRTLNISMNVDMLYTKKSMRRRKQAQMDFQNQVLSQMRLKGRNCFRSDIVMSISFTVNHKNPPGLHSLLKNYLDLFQSVVTGSGEIRKYVLMKDDNQIKCLNAFLNVDESLEHSSIEIWCLNYRSFIQNLKFISDVESGVIVNEDEPFEREEDDSNIIEELESPSNQEYVSNLRTWINEATNDKERDLAERTLKSHVEFQKYQLLDSQSTLSIGSILPLFTKVSFPESMKHYEEMMEFMARIAALNSLFSIDLGSVPSQKGEGEEFKMRVRIKLQRYVGARRQPLPKFGSISVRVFYERPKKALHDLDNIIRKIVPIIEQELDQVGIDYNQRSIEICQIANSKTSLDKGRLHIVFYGFLNSIVRKGIHGYLRY